MSEVSQVLNAKEMSLGTYQEFQAIIYKLSGIALADSKRALLMNRISKRMRTLKLSTPEQYLSLIQESNSDEIGRLIDVVSTNTTHFFREEPHFEFLKKLCSEWKQEKKSNIKIWCAASSSGQEPYTISMVLKENLEKSTLYQLLATDICTDVLLEASKGVYDEQEVSNIPQNYLDQYFELINSDHGKLFLAKPQIKSQITYKRFNLADFPYPLKGNFDLIFCRNVMIYFDRPMRQKVIDQFYKLLNAGGYMILSHSENVLGINHSFKSLGSSIYRKE